jgi:aerobic-type carbon monoxide dehydrogenase small subunit (CoxS/CutS family)
MKPPPFVYHDPTTVANPDPSEAQVRDAISGNICRCTGYQSIVASALAAARAMREPVHQP